jgi:cyclophilin family peptidyl-prolyl cis-trans isomerase
LPIYLPPIPTMLKRYFLPFLALALLNGCSESPKSGAARPAAPTAEPENPNNPQVLIDTSEGKILVELYGDKAPLSAQNFLSYVADKHFDQTVFHRVIKGFMIQGGGFEDRNGNFVEKATKPPIKNEHSNGLKNRRGTLSMARTGDPHSATSQFFINTVDNKDKLDTGDGYAVFGKVLSGMEVVDAIEGIPTASQNLTSRVGDQLVPSPSEDVPQRTMRINSITKTK